MSIKRLLNVVECGGDIGRWVAALVLPISNRPRVTSSCAGKIGLRKPGEHTSGPNLVSRDSVAHNQTLYDSRNAATGHPALSKKGPDIRYQMVACWGDVGAVLVKSNVRVRGPPQIRVRIESYLSTDSAAIPIGSSFFISSLPVAMVDKVAR
jgi:hypothetical protein